MSIYSVNKNQYITATLFMDVVMLVYNTLYLAQIMGGSGGVESLNSSLLLMMDIPFIYEHLLYKY